MASDSGELRIAGRVFEHHNPVQAHALGIAVVYQQPALFPDLTVAENIASRSNPAAPGGASIGKSATVPREKRCRAPAPRSDPNARVSTLSMPEQQIVEIAKAIGARSKILILDEPTASLTDREVERLFQVIATVRAEGAGMIISRIGWRKWRRSPTASPCCATARPSRLATPKASRARELIRMMVGREIEAIFPKRAVPIGDVALEVRNLHSRAAGIRGVSLEVRAGEILGLSGLVGSGRTQLAETIFGLTPAETPVRSACAAATAQITCPADAIRHRIGYVPEDRRQHGIVMSMPISANVSLANLPAIMPPGA